MVVDHAKLGYDISAFLGIYLDKSSLYDDVSNELEKIPEVVGAHYTTGLYNIFAKIVCRDTTHLREVLHDKIQKIPGIQRTETFISLQESINRPIHILEHGATNNNFDYELKTIKEGFEYQLVVKPKDSSTPAFGMIKLTTDSLIPRYRRQMAFVCVRRQPAPASTQPANP